MLPGMGEQHDTMGEPAAAEGATVDKITEALDAMRDRARMYVALGEGHAVLASGNAAQIREASRHFFSAATGGWEPKRHARVYLLELLRQVPEMATKAPEQLPAFLRDGARTLREAFEFVCPSAKDAAPEIYNAWFIYWVLYPEHARLLTSDQVTMARRLYRGEAPNKWIELAELFARIGLGGVKPHSLASDDRAWRRLHPRSEIPGSEK